METNNPKRPYFPYIQKNEYISFPDAKPAPIIVPIITKHIFIIFLIKNHLFNFIKYLEKNAYNWYKY